MMHWQRRCMPRPLGHALYQQIQAKDVHLMKRLPMCTSYVPTSARPSSQVRIRHGCCSSQSTSTTAKMGASTRKKNLGHHHVMKCTFSSSVPLSAETHSDESTTIENAKPYKDVPRMNSLLSTVTILKMMFFGPDKNSQTQTLEAYERFGPIWTMKVAGVNLVSISDVDAIEKMFRHEGRLPRRMMVEPWRTWREKSGFKGGLFSVDGEDWKRCRVALDKKMMRPINVASYTDNLNEVVADFVARIKRLRDEHAENHTVPNIDQELFKWSFESIGTILYETRFGGLNENPSAEMMGVVKAVRGIFETTTSLMMVPTALQPYILPGKLRRHDSCWETAFGFGKKIVDQKFGEIKQLIEEGEQVSGFLASLLSSETMSQSEVYTTLIEVTLGATDTTSNTMQWVLYCLAQHPEVQEHIYQELTSTVPPGELPSHDDIQKMKYLKATIKEVLRLYPVVSSVSRVLDEDIVLRGYNIPAKLLQNFKIEPTDNKPIRVIDRGGFLGPERLVNVRYIDRT